MAALQLTIGKAFFSVVVEEFSQGTPR